MDRSVHRPAFAVFGRGRSEGRHRSRDIHRGSPVPSPGGGGGLRVGPPYGGQAYRLLEEEGVLTRKRGDAYRVAQSAGLRGT